VKLAGVGLQRDGWSLHYTVRSSRGRTKRTAVERGQRVHREFAQQMRTAGHQAEVVLENTGRRLDGLMVDAQRKILTLIELKPVNQRALERGAAQVGQYADDVAALIRDRVGQWAQYADYVIRTEVRPYP
jgi:hypothetical protein